MDKANTYTPEEYQHRLLSAIYYFVVDKNLKAAIKELEKCSQIPDPTWRLSKAFLLAYKGKMDDAVRYYNAAFKLEATHQVHFETEEFIDWVLQEE